MSIMDAWKVTQYGLKETQRKKFFLYLYSLYRTVCSFVTSV